MAKTLFKEKQQFKRVEVIGLIVFFMLGIAYKMISELIQPSNDFSLVMTVSLLMLGIFGLILKYLLALRLKLKVQENHLSFSMPPLKKSKEKIKWEDVDSCRIIETPSITQWHGGNISFNHEKRYSFNGRNGVHIITKNGTEYFIGSNNISNLREAVSKAMEIAS